jgi:hypothetical protein
VSLIGLRGFLSPTKSESRSRYDLIREMDLDGVSSALYWLDNSARPRRKYLRMHLRLRLDY